MVFFIECGANDGEFLTNTIGLEANLNWTGLLIEASPSLFKQLRSKNRKAWTAGVCLSGEIEKVEFLKLKNFNTNPGAGLINPGKYPKHKDWGGEIFNRDEFVSEGEVECFPILSLLSAINVTTVDFFSLDVQGHEYKILKVIPFDKIDIKVLLVEWVFDPEGADAMRDLMTGNGYNVVVKTDMDFIFTKRDLEVYEQKEDATA